MLCIYVLGVSSQDSEMSCIWVLMGIKSGQLDVMYLCVRGIKSGQ
jgi:hypothetical protein